MPAVATMPADAFATIWSSIETLAKGTLGIYFYDLGFQGVDQYNMTGPPPGFQVVRYKPARMVNAFHPNVNTGPKASNDYGRYKQWVTDTHNPTAPIFIGGAGDTSSAGVYDNYEWAATGMGYTDSCVKFGQGWPVSNTVRYGLSTQMGLDQNKPYFDLNPFVDDYTEAYQYVLKQPQSIFAVTVNTDHFEILVAGYYKFCNTMLYMVPEWANPGGGYLPGRDSATETSATLQFNQPKNIMSNFVIAKNTTPDSTPDYALLNGLVNYKRFGPIGASAYIRNWDFHNNGSSSITEVQYCNVGDLVGVSLEAETYFAHGDEWQRVCTPATGSSFTAELIFVGVGDQTYVHPYGGDSLADVP